MPRIVRVALVSIRDLVLTAGPFVLIAVALLAAAYLVLDPAPPKRVVLATGPELSAYARFGERYAEEMKRYGIQVELRPTLGAFENRRLLRDPKEHVDLAFVQGGSGDSPRATEEEKANMVDLVSLGTLFYEPVWIFYRTESARKLNRDAALAAVPQMRGWSVNIGARGSGTPGLMNKLLYANGMERTDLKRSNFDETTAVVALLEGKLDAAVLVSAPESQMVQMLLQTPGIKVYEYAQAEAYARRYPFLSPVVLPRGVVDLAREVPPQDVTLIATTSSLLAREDIHPALVQLFAQAASRIHSGAGWIARAGSFPNAQQSEFELAKDAARYYQSGPPLLQRYLPFWLANLVDRMWVALFSIVAVLIPLSRLVPPLYEFRVRSRIFRWYRNLRQIESDHEHGEKSAPELLGALDKLESRVSGIAVPLSYADELYALRTHIALVRVRLQKAA
ncbi:MAG: C4-dicarboxylate ABC transporter substrate-binding protein [Betaproteobacteria bacterium RIFCSPLOWO2_12_FULL_65_14]|nr:MAG: C4-dicarboxylate ABC transporter substrate-binding protein [Betaproteobacteria bacterium RIFCSPLOWO2_12_FULL_65_14]